MKNSPMQREREQDYMKILPVTQRAYHWHPARTRWKRLVGVFKAEAEDNSVSCGACVSCQQAASGLPKCTICDQVCRALIPCTAATDDEDVSEHVTYAFAARTQQL